MRRENGIVAFSQALALLGAGSEMPGELDELPEVGRGAARGGAQRLARVARRNMHLFGAWHTRGHATNNTGVAGAVLLLQALAHASKHNRTVAGGIFRNRCAALMK